MASVGEAYAILKGRKSGDARRASEFLSGLSQNERAQRNRIESRHRKGRRTQPYKLGERIRRKER